MAKAYGDDLRRKFLLAYDQGEDTLEDLADRLFQSTTLCHSERSGAQSRNLRFAERAALRQLWFDGAGAAWYPARLRWRGGRAIFLHLRRNVSGYAFGYAWRALIFWVGQTRTGDRNTRS